MPNIPQEERDRLSPVWDLSQERAFTMTLINQRIQFFIVFFSAVVGGALNARAQAHMNIILCIGVTIVWLLALVIFLTQRRLERIMSLIVADDTHPYTIVMPSKRFRVQRIMSYIIPTLCGILLTVGAVLSILGYLLVKDFVAQIATETIVLVSLMCGKKENQTHLPSP